MQSNDTKDRFELKITEPGSGIIIYHIRKEKGVTISHDTYCEIGYAVIQYNDSVLLKEYIEVIMFIDSEDVKIINLSDLKKEACKLIRDKIDKDHKIYISMRIIDNLVSWDVRDNCE